MFQAMKCSVALLWCTALVTAHGQSNDVAHHLGSEYAPFKRDACAAPAASTTTNYYNADLGSSSAFTNDAKISSVAAAAPTPSGYVRTFENLHAASSESSLLTYTVVESGIYDVPLCASKCSGSSGCVAFNIYFERDPVVDPSSECTNPQPFVAVKCAFFSGALDASSAINTGQWQFDFQVGLAGSNGYTLADHVSNVSSSGGVDGTGSQSGSGPGPESDGTNSTAFTGSTSSTPSSTSQQASAQPAEATSSTSGARGFACFPIYIFVALLVLSTLPLG